MTVNPVIIADKISVCIWNNNYTSSVRHCSVCLQFHTSHFYICKYIVVDFQPCTHV